MQFTQYAFSMELVYGKKLDGRELAHGSDPEGELAIGNNGFLALLD